LQGLKLKLGRICVINQSKAKDGFAGSLSTAVHQIPFFSFSMEEKRTARRKGMTNNSRDDIVIAEVDNCTKNLQHSKKLLRPAYARA
jgi:hypothetical protein